jgi:hypothetical protein
VVGGTVQPAAATTGVLLQVGFFQPPKGMDGVALGPWSFDVARDGSIWLLDEVKHRLLVWRRGRPGRPGR